MSEKIHIEPYEDEDLSFEDERIQKLINFFDEYGIDYDKFDLSKIPRLNLDKNAYPNTDPYVNIPGLRNTDKWLQTVKDLYYKEKSGESRRNSIRSLTVGWSLNEIYDFLNWLKFYEQGNHMKYKRAQLWYENSSPGYFLPIKKDVERQDVNHAIDSNLVENVKVEDTSTGERKQIIERQRSKIIGRLDSVEKLIRSHEGQLFSGKEFENLIEAIYSLKKKIHLVNKMSMSNRTYNDMIVREANILKRNGFTKAADVLFVTADDSIPTLDKTAPAIPSAPPAPPGQSSGAPGGMPSMGPGMPQGAIAEDGNDSPTPEGLSKFLENLETANITTVDKNLSEDDLEVCEADDVDELEVFDTDELEVFDNLVVEAQVAPPVKPIEKIPTKPEVKTEVKPEKTNISTEVKQPSTDKFDSMIDAAFANLSINDIIAKLEDLSKVFKVREIPRQLSIVDMMLDKLGLASFFPSLSEATNKSLESNNYISSRVDDILAKLKGSLKGSNIDLKGNTDTQSPEVESAKQNLKNQTEKEQSKKEMRKKLEDEALEVKEVPEVDMKEDLETPTAPVPTAPPPVKPV